MPASLGYSMAGFSLFVLVTTFPGKMGIPLMPDLVPTFGVGFAVLFLAAQYALAARLRSGWAAAIITGTAIVAAVAGTVTRNAGLLGPLEGHNSSPTRHALGMGACAAGVVFGWAIAKGWFEPDV